jgi:hypothetical protein
MHATTLIVALEEISVDKGKKEATNIAKSADMPAQSGLNVLSIVDHTEHSVKRVEVGQEILLVLPNQNRILSLDSASTLWIRYQHILELGTIHHLPT